MRNTGTMIYQVTPTATYSLGLLSLSDATMKSLGMENIEHIMSQDDPAADIECRIQGQWMASSMDGMHAYCELKKHLHITPAEIDIF